MGFLLSFSRAVHLLSFQFSMADSKDRAVVPSWDGAARSWRRYTREVAWWVQSVPVYKRRYCGAQLLSRLTGPARLLAMSWSTLVLDDKEGVKVLLQKLASSPLVRKSLPNAAAICQQYFSFRRNPSETGISSFGRRWSTRNLWRPSSVYTKKKKV